MDKLLFVKIERGIVPKAVFDKFVAAHIEYVRALRAGGRRIESGYWAERGGGMMVFEAESPAEARQIVENDPLVMGGCVEYDLHQWCQVGC